MIPRVKTDVLEQRVLCKAGVLWLIVQPCPFQCGIAGKAFPHTCLSMDLPELLSHTSLPSQESRGLCSCLARTWCYFRKINWFIIYLPQEGLLIYSFFASQKHPPKGRLILLLGFAEELVKFSPSSTKITQMLCFLRKDKPAPTAKLTWKKDVLVMPKAIV